MRGQGLLGLSVARLRGWLLALFLILALPTAALIWHSYNQLKWEAFHQSRLQAQQLSARIDRQLVGIMRGEQQRAIDDFKFQIDAAGRVLNLSRMPSESPIPGLISYFQVDANGRFSTPLLPGPAALIGVSSDQRRLRDGIERQVRTILANNRLVPSAPAVFSEAQPGQQPGDVGGGRQSSLDAETTVTDMAVARKESMASPAPSAAAKPRSSALNRSKRELAAAAPPISQQAFDSLGQSKTRAKMRNRSQNQLGSVSDLKLRKPFEARVETEEKRRAARPGMQSERLAESRADDASVAAPAQAASGKAEVVTTFRSEVDPYVFRLLDSGHFVMFRNVWRSGQRIIQGALIDQRGFFAGVVVPTYLGSALADFSSLALAHQGDVLQAVSGQANDRYLTTARDLAGSLLYQSRLSAPLSDLELVYTVNRLPAAPGAWVIGWTGALLGLLLPGIFYMLYLLGRRQIELARQQQDFVSAVSHELRTPLTSIRMYGEMLKSGWATEDKKQSYYEFIHDESERLSRLISNVLQLARMNREELQPDLKRLTLGQLNDEIASKVASQIERAGFDLRLSAPSEPARQIMVDPDFFSQIVINLIDNAIKFSADSETKRIDVGWQLSDEAVALTVRDHGPGIARDQIKKIFGLFYRSENELTRKTVGTGIGLALVNQLARAMDASADVANAEPGALFRVRFPVTKGEDCQ